MVARQAGILHGNVQQQFSFNNVRTSTSNSAVSYLHVPTTLPHLQVAVGEQGLSQVCLFNYGNYKFQYHWHLSESCTLAGSQMVSMYPLHGVVEPHNKTSCDLTFAPPKHTSLRNCSLTLEVRTLCM